MADNESRIAFGLCASRLRTGAAVLSLMVLAGCAEMMDSLLDVAEVSYCGGCDWIVQEFDDGHGWSTHNSDPYVDAETCEKALKPQAQHNDETGYRCIYEGDLNDAKDNKQTIQWEADRVNRGHCWHCDWRVEEWEVGTWNRRDAKTYKTEGLCEQALWYQMQDNPYERYRCTF